MRVRRLLIAAFPISAAIVVACAHPVSDDAQSEAQSSGEARTIPLGSCHLSSFPTAPADLAADSLHPPAGLVDYPGSGAPITADEVIADVKLSARIQTRNGRRIVDRIDANIGIAAANARQGSATLDVTYVAWEHDEGTSSTGRPIAGETRRFTGASAIPDGGLEAGARIAAADAGDAGPQDDTFRLGNNVATLDSIQLSRVGGDGWTTFATADKKLIGLAPHCRFDERAWTVLKDVTCEGQLYDGVQPDGGSSCALLDGSVSPSNGNDAGPPPDAGAALDASTGAGDAGTSDAAVLPDAGDAGAEAETPITNSQGGASSGADDGSSLTTKGTSKRTSAGDSGCSLALGTQTSGVGSFALVGLALAAVARRRRARC